MDNLKFTQEIKDKWLEALKSGKYIQGTHTLRHNFKGEIQHCCIGVLGEIHPNLELNLGASYCPYNFLERNIGYENMSELYKTNDSLGSNDAKDYSNVIPLIEKLKVLE